MRKCSYKYNNSRPAVDRYGHAWRLVLIKPIFSMIPDAKMAPAAKGGCHFSSFKALIKWCNCGVVSCVKRENSINHRYYFAFSKILPWQIKSTLVMSKYFLLSYHFRFGKRMSKIQFCLKNSRSTSSGRGVWFGYFSRRGAAEPSMM